MPGPPDGPEPMPPAGYDEAGLPPQPPHDSPVCHVCASVDCRRSRIRIRGVWRCPVCDSPPIPPR